MNIKRTNISGAETKKIPIFLMITPDAFIDAFKESSNNVWLAAYIEDQVFDVLDLERNLFGSKVIDGILYYCEHNLDEIEINGEAIDAEDALDNYSVEELSSYIDVENPMSADEILSTFTYYEMYPIDWDDYAEDLIKENSFIKVVSDAYALDVTIVD